MSVISDRRERAIECDRCPETTDPMDRDDFSKMVAVAAKDGWLIEPDGKGGYVHLCPSCRGQSRLAAAQAKFKD